MTLPSGEVWYIVPGHPSYVFDPVASNATGRKVFHPNPADEIKNHDEEEERRRDLEDQQAFNASIPGQLIPVAASVGGMYAAHELMSPGATAIQHLGNGQVLMSDGTIKGAGLVNNPAANAATQGALGNTPPVTGAPISGSGTPPIAGDPSVGGGAYPVQTMSDGSTMLSDGSIVPPGAEGAVANSWYMTPGSESTLGTIGSGLAMAKGGYDMYNAWNNGGKGMRTGMTEMGYGIGSMFGGPLPGAVGAAMGNLAGYGMQGDGVKNYAALAANPITWPLIPAKILGFGPHKSTKQHQAERWAEVANDPNSSDYWKNSAAVHDQVRNDAMAGKFDDQPEWTLEGTVSKIKAGDVHETEMFEGVMGHREAFGNDWGEYTPEQRREIIRRSAEEDLYVGDHGDVYFKDNDRAKQIRDEVIASGGTPSQAEAAAQGAMRTSSRSPGIDMNGNRIRY